MTRKDYCNWDRADDDSDMYETECGSAFVLNDGTPLDNHMAFCPYCGGELIDGTTPPVIHDSDCALHRAPAMPVGPCNCTASDGDGAA